ncbi:hypothetical protein [Clostridium perfringens]|uniref:hypothetical protein n=1 Tax=Clostridium perfringens TaxID=1502 RepID=UPI00096A76F2|nr:hypothetical protein [Clostridium perfringens]
MSKVYLNSKDEEIRWALEPMGERLELLFEVERDLEVYDVLKAKDKFYCVSIKERETGSVGVDEINFKINPEPVEIEGFICPYCGYEDADSFEYDEEGETFCSICGSTLRYERIGYDFNVYPVFPTSIIVID